MTQELPEHHLDIVEAIAILTDCTPGDVFYKIEDGGFVDVAIEALKAFSRDYYKMDRIEDSDPVDDLKILTDCLLDLKSELKIATNPKEVRDLRSDIANIQQRIQITES